MTDNDFQKRVQHFAILKSKYQASDYEDPSPSSPLYLILRKVDLGIELTKFELNWLTQQKLHRTSQLISHQRVRSSGELLRRGNTGEYQQMKIEFSNLKSKYEATHYLLRWQASPLYFILYKLDCGYRLTDSEMTYLQDNHLDNIVMFVTKIDQFVTLKAKCQATQFQDSFSMSLLYSILRRLEEKQRLTNDEVNWLKSHEFFEVLAIFQQQESAKEAEFIKLKAKYKATTYPESDVSNPLYQILQNLETGKPLSQAELQWLKAQQLVETFELAKEIEQKRLLAEQQRHFAELKKKYKATQDEESSPSSHLYQVLKQIDLGKPPSDSNLNFLKKLELWQTRALAIDKYVTSLKSKFKSKNPLTEAEINWLKNYGREDIIIAYLEFQLESGNQLNPVEMDLLTDNRRENLIIAHLKLKLELTIQLNPAEIEVLKHNGRFEIIVAHLKSKLDLGKPLSEAEINWLKQNGREDLIILAQVASLKSKVELGHLLNDTEIDWLKQKERQDIITFAIDKYTARLKSKAESGNKLTPAEINWLKHNGGEDIIIVDLKFKAKSGSRLNKAEINWLTQHGGKDIILAHLKSHAASGNPLTQPEIEWLTKNGHENLMTLAIEKYAAKLKSKRKKLTPTEINWLKNNGREDILIAYLKSQVESGNQLTKTEINWLKQKKHEDIINLNAKLKYFVFLKSKYDVSGYRDDSPSNRLYAILQQLEKGKRLEATEVVWLAEKSLFHSDDKIFITYHKIEATFYEQEYKRTGNKWNLPNASSHWRSAQKPEHALTLTDNLNFDKIKENKLKSALLTTRGGAFRDIGQLDEAEQCAQQAMKYQPNSHHPYTLMGAICYDRREYSEGEHWFNEAIKRGASPRDIDAEIKRVFRNADKDKRLEILAYLQKTNHRLSKWAKSMLK